MSTAIALAVIRGYRMIPPRIRRVWSFGTSTSHLALAAALNGDGWAAFRYARISFMPYPSWTDPGPQGTK